MRPRVDFGTGEATLPLPSDGGSGSGFAGDFVPLIARWCRGARARSTAVARRAASLGRFVRGVLFAQTDGSEAIGAQGALRLVESADLGHVGAHVAGGVDAGADAADLPRVVEVGEDDGDVRLAGDVIEAALPVRR